uniref:GPR1/FUN34/yaaH family protein n=1 Tax=Romanomermis culicivorax TaxID=13658 RepID=A0A915K9B4_ROMCU
MQIADGHNGLASFAITATLFQFHNFGWVKVPSVLFLGMILGGLVQMFAGLLEFATGNGFGFAIFSVFGSFWITLVLIILGKMFMGPEMQTSETDMGWFMLTFLIFTFILLVSSLKHNTILPLLILTLFLGILFLMISHFCNEASKATVSERPFKLTGAIFLLINSFMAYYFLAAILMEDVYQRKILPVGPSVSDFLFNRRRRAANYRRDPEGRVN